MNGRWSNAACMGYAAKAMSVAGVDERVIEKVIAAMTWVFDDLSVQDAENFLTGWMWKGVGTHDQRKKAGADTIPNRSGN